MNLASPSSVPEPNLAVIRIDSADDVAVTLRRIEPGEIIGAAGQKLVARDAVDRGHKLALRDIAAGETVRKFGWPIGRATVAIPAGAHIHTHNLETLLKGVEGYRYDRLENPALPFSKDAQFLGYRRKNGRVGTRNEIWILPT